MRESYQSKTIYITAKELLTLIRIGKIEGEKYEGDSVFYIEVED